MDLEDLKSPKIQERLKGAKTPEGILALAKEECYKLADDELEGISGGDI